MVLRFWLQRLLYSLLIGLLAGLLSYLVARACTSAYLLYQQQQFVQDTLGLLRGGDLRDLATSDLRDVRMLVDRLEAQYQRLSIQIGFAGAAAAAILSYLRMEYAAASNTDQNGIEHPTAPDTHSQ
jgi:hypothetical protein